MDALVNLLQRYSDDGQSTLGVMFTSRQASPLIMELSGYTLEDEFRSVKVPGETRISAGYYELKEHKILTPKTQEYRDKYPWFIWHIEVMDVPNFSNVYVHIGNRDTDTDGCILLASTTNDNIAGDGFIGGSTQEFQRWYTRHVNHFLQGGQAFLRVRDEDYLFQGL